LIKPTGWKKGKKWSAFALRHRTEGRISRDGQGRSLQGAGQLKKNNMKNERSRSTAVPVEGPKKGKTKQSHGLREKLLRVTKGELGRGPP